MKRAFLQILAIILMMFLVVGFMSYLTGDLTFGQDTKTRIPTEKELDQKLEMLSTKCVIELKKVNDTIQAKNKVLYQKIKHKAQTKKLGPKSEIANK